jgi:hypothetical protein
MRIRDPGWKKFGSRIRDKHPGSATLNLVLFMTSDYLPTADPYLVPTNRNLGESETKNPDLIPTV